MNAYNLELTVTVTDELIESVIEMAGYGISYWASAAHWDQEARTYRVTGQPDVIDEGEQETKTLKYGHIAVALQQVLRDRLIAGTYMDYLRRAVFDNDGGEIDAALGDAIIQVAFFGEVRCG